jgi:hypothetical protein
MHKTTQYQIDSRIVLQKAYNLLCTFFANKEIARRSDPHDPSAPLTSLENLFFTAEASRLLLEIAISIRVLDDQMSNTSTNDAKRKRYENIRLIIDQYEYALFDDLNLNLREVCNKIIHSDVLEPHTTEGHEAHEFDFGHIYEGSEKEIIWKHLNGFVRLSGKKGNNQWHVLLNIEVFTNAVFKLMAELENP